MLKATIPNEAMCHTKAAIFTKQKLHEMHGETDTTKTGNFKHITGGILIFAGGIK